MKKMILFLLLGGLVACQQNETQSGDFDLSGFETTKVSGTDINRAVKKDASGKILEEGFIKAGQKHGQWITYDPNKGSVKTIDSYVNGKLNGYSFVISSRGYIDEQSGFSDNTLDGMHFKYRYGRPKSKTIYNQGKLDGIQEEYYDNGKLQQKTEFKNGVQDGIYEYYSDDGILRMSYTYKNGEKIEGGMVEAPETVEE